MPYDSHIIARPAGHIIIRFQLEEDLREGCHAAAKRIGWKPTPAELATPPLGDDYHKFDSDTTINIVDKRLPIDIDNPRILAYAGCRGFAVWQPDSGFYEVIAFTEREFLVSKAYDDIPAATNTLIEGTDYRCPGEGYADVWEWDSEHECWKELGLQVVVSNISDNAINAGTWMVVHADGHCGPFVPLLFGSTVLVRLIAPTGSTGYEDGDPIPPTSSCAFRGKVTAIKVESGNFCTMPFEDETTECWVVAMKVKHPHALIMGDVYEAYYMDDDGGLAVYGIEERIPILSAQVYTDISAADLPTLGYGEVDVQRVADTEGDNADALETTPLRFTVWNDKECVIPAGEYVKLTWIYDRYIAIWDRDEWHIIEGEVMEDSGSCAAECDPPGAAASGGTLTNLCGIFPRCGGPLPSEPLAFENRFLKYFKTGQRVWVQRVFDICENGQTPNPAWVLTEVPHRMTIADRVCVDENNCVINKVPQLFSAPGEECGSEQVIEWADCNDDCPAPP